MIDVHHLTAHQLAGHDLFVTSDNMVKQGKRERLRAEVGIIVATPAEAVTMALAEAAT